MNDILSIIANICGIAGFLISLFNLNEVKKIKSKVENNQKAIGSGNSQTMTVTKNG